MPSCLAGLPHTPHAFVGALGGPREALSGGCSGKERGIPGATSSSPSAESPVFREGGRDRVAAVQEGSGPPNSSPRGQGVSAAASPSGPGRQPGRFAVCSPCSLSHASVGHLCDGRGGSVLYTGGFQDKMLEACLRGSSESRPAKGGRGAPHRGEGIPGRGSSRGLRASTVPSESLARGCRHLPGS